MKILFLSRWFPFPPDNGAKLRIFHLLRGLSQAHKICLLSFSDNLQEEQSFGELGNICSEIHQVLWKEFDPRSWRSIGGIFNSTPRSLTDTYSREMAKLVERKLKEDQFDLVIASEWQMSVYRTLFAHLPVLYEELEVGVLYGEYKTAGSIPTRIRTGLTWAKHRQFLSRLLANDQICTVVSEQEKKILSSIAPHNQSIYVIPNGVELDHYTGCQEKPEPNSLVFTGSFRYRPNFTAMGWFIKEVLPIVQAHVPQVKVFITGNPGETPLPPNPAIHQIGYVDDVSPYIARAWISIVPLLEGGGTRLKILEAMAIGTPIVSTSKGAEGLEIKGNEHLLIADTPGEFAQKILALLCDEQLRRRLAVNARQLIAEKYDWPIIMPDFLDVVGKAVSSHQPRHPTHAIEKMNS